MENLILLLITTFTFSFIKEGFPRIFLQLVVARCHDHIIYQFMVMDLSFQI